MVIGWTFYGFQRRYLRWCSEDCCCSLWNCMLKWTSVLILFVLLWHNTTPYISFICLIFTNPTDLLLFMRWRCSVALLLTRSQPLGWTLLLPRSLPMVGCYPVRVGEDFLWDQQKGVVGGPPPISSLWLIKLVNGEYNTLRGGFGKINSTALTSVFLTGNVITVADAVVFAAVYPIMVGLDFLMSWIVSVLKLSCW